MRAEPGSLFAFLPGAAEIRRTRTLLENRTDPATDVVALYGALAGEEQDRAILPAPAGRRKIVLATSIAETSITIEGVRIVVDCGLARVPRYEPDVGVTRLETVRVSRAAADQRRGRAGRTEPGVCYRLWDEPQTAALEPFARPEILAADLSSFALDLAAWGSGPQQLAFLDPPPGPALNEAKALLAELGAIDADGRITEEGRRLRRLPLPPRLARMVVDAAGAGEAQLAAETCRFNFRARPGRRRCRLARARCRASPRPLAARPRCPRHGGALGGGGNCSLPRVSARAAKSRRHTRRARLPRTHRQKSRRRARRVFAGEWPRCEDRCRFAAGARAVPRRGRLTGSAAQGRILSAAPIALTEIEARFADRIEAHEEIAFDAASGSLRGRKSRRLGAIALAEAPTPVEPSDATVNLLAAAITKTGIDRLPWTKPLRQWRDRVMFLRASEGANWPDLSDAALDEYRARMAQAGARRQNRARRDRGG